MGDIAWIAIVPLFLSQAGLLLPAFGVYASRDEPEHQGCFRADAYGFEGDRHKVWEVGEEKDEPAHTGERHKQAQNVREKGRPVDQVADQQAVGSEEEQGTKARRGWKSEVQNRQDAAGQAKERRDERENAVYRPKQAIKEQRQKAIEYSSERSFFSRRTTSLRVVAAEVVEGGAPVEAVEAARLAQRPRPAVRLP